MQNFEPAAQEQPNKHHQGPYARGETQLEGVYLLTIL